jgi:hypothetical protein
MEEQHQGKWSSCMLADYCRTLRRDVPQAKCSRKSSAVAFQLVYTLCDDVNTGFLQNSTTRHLKTLHVKKLTNHLNSAQKMPLVSPTLVCVTRKKSYRVY